jgi:hypothetical protein
MGKIRAMQITPPYTGTINSITVYLDESRAGSVGHKVKCAVYNSYLNSSTDIYTFIAETNEQTIHNVTDWVTFTFSNPPTLVGGTSYFIVVWTETTADGSCGIFHTGGSFSLYSTVTYGSWPSPITGESSDTYICLYCEFEYTIPRIFSGDISIYYNSMIGDEFIPCNCSSWDSNDQTLTLITWMNKSDATTLRDNIVPGAVGQLYQILGKPHYYDKTWEGGNTIFVVPNVSSTSNIKNKYNSTVMYVKDFAVTPIENNKTYLQIKISGYISSNT